MVDLSKQKRKDSEKMNSRKLLAKIIECFGNQSGCAIAMGISRTYLNQLINGKREFSYSMMVKIIEVLNLTEREILDIFFLNVVDKSKE